MCGYQLWKVDFIAKDMIKKHRKKSCSVSFKRVTPSQILLFVLTCDVPLWHKTCRRHGCHATGCPWGKTEPHQRPPVHWIFHRVLVSHQHKWKIQILLSLKKESCRIKNKRCFTTIRGILRATLCWYRKDMYFRIRNIWINSSVHLLVV